MFFRKMLLSFLGLFFCLTLYSQNTISFSELNFESKILSETFKKHKVLKIKENVTLLTDGAEFTVNYIENYSFFLKENRLLSKEFCVFLKGERDVKKKRIEDLGFDGQYFTNIDRTLNNQMALSVFENQYSLYLKSSGNEFYIEPLTRYDASAPRDYYVFYESKDVPSINLTDCLDKNPKSTNFGSVNMLQQELDGDCKTVELNFCADYSLYIAYSTINATINKTFEVLNLVQLDYSIANGLAFDVEYKVKRYYIVTCNNCNYWDSTDSLSMNNSYFIMYENYSRMFDIYSDIKVFWQNYISSSGVLGLGSQDSLNSCNSTSTLATIGSASIRTFPYNSTCRSILSHEFGHNFNCQHIDSSSNVMNSGGSSSSYWEPASVSMINYKLSNSNCFTNCQAELCFNKKVDNLVVDVNSINKTINASWQPEENIQYKTRLFNFSTNTWSDYTFLSFPTDTISYNYNTSSSNCSIKYKFEIVPVCSGVDGFKQTIMLTVPVNQSPNLYFESTAQDNTLCSNTEYTFTVASTYPGTTPLYQWKINGLVVGYNSANFSTSLLQNGDVLSCTITSNEPCLASQSATITKTLVVIPEPCGELSNSEFETNDIKIFPNPVKNSLAIKSQDSIKRVVIFNILGQKMLEKIINESQTTLDLSYFSNAAYFVRIELEHQTQVIKIIKQ